MKKSTAKLIRKLEPGRMQGALARLDIDLAMLDAAPRITDILKRVFSVKFGRPIAQVIHYLSASDSPAARAWLHAWKSVSARDRETLPIEAICIRANVSPLEILGAILMAAKSLSAQESALKAIISHPDVMDATIKYAKTKYGVSDRKMLHESPVIGFLPGHKGQSIAINLGNSGNTDGESDPDSDAFDKSFPAISSKLELWGDRRRELTSRK